MREAESATPAGTEAVKDGDAPRPLRSFVRRQGRISTAQLRHLEETLPRIEIPFVAHTIDLDACFGRMAPKVIEIGFGMGDTTAQIALAHTGIDYLGIEVHMPGVGSLCKQVAERGISNLRVLCHDAVEVFRDMIAADVLTGIHIYFPDPWHKKRHNKRRLIQSPFVSLLASRLVPGGYLHCATDWEDYAAQMLEVLGKEPLLRNTVAGYAPRPEHRPLTRFENRGIRLGHSVRDLVFVRI